MPAEKPKFYLVRGSLKKPIVLTSTQSKSVQSDSVQSKSLQSKAKITLSHKVEDLSLAIERMKLAEYVELLNKPLRLLYINFIAGVARGVGMTIGFAILGALIIYTLQRLAILRLPVIGGFIAELVRIVQIQLNLGR